MGVISAADGAAVVGSPPRGVSISSGEAVAASHGGGESGEHRREDGTAIEEAGTAIEEAVPLR